MAGLGIRNWELARTLRDCAQVTIAHGGREAGELDGVTLVPYRPHAPRAATDRLADADAVVTAPGWPPLMRALRRSSARVIVDLYDPETLETLELLSGRRRVVRAQAVAATLDRLHDALRTGHHFMCASESQRDLWLGAMLGLRMIDPDIYDRDPSYRSVIDLVPFGAPDDPPVVGDGPGPRELFGLSADAELVLWNGGLWQWLDAETAVRALALLRERRPRATLVFMGGAGDHPAARRSAAAARALAADLGQLGSGVYFNERWVSYADRAAWLAQADCAVASARDHLESRFAFRTRVLDCLWAGLPIACTTGDELAERVAREGLGAVAAPGDAEGLARAMAEVLERGSATYAPALLAAATDARWSRAAMPLRRWVRAAAVPGDGAPRRALGALRPPLAQRMRDGLYSTVGRRLLEARR
jgi:hypothetical protein